MTRRRPVRYPGVLGLLGSLADRYAAVALISGGRRPFWPTMPLPGRYGLEEIRHGQLVVDPHRAPARPAVAAAANLRERPAVRDSGAWLEDKRDAVAVHIRRLPTPNILGARRGR